MQNCYAATKRFAMCCCRFQENAGPIRLSFRAGDSELLLYGGFLHMYAARGSKREIAVYLFSCSESILSVRSEFDSVDMQEDGR